MAVKKASIKQSKAIRELALMKMWAPTQVFGFMKERGFLDPPNPALSKRTVERMVSEARQPDESGRWSLLTANPVEAGRVLDVVTYLCDATEGRGWPTNEDVAWFARVRTACPVVPARWAALLGFAYKGISTQAKPDSRLIDVTLAAEPWTSDEQRRAWAAMILRWPQVLEEVDVEVLEILEIAAGTLLRANVFGDDAELTPLTGEGEYPPAFAPEPSPVSGPAGASLMTTPISTPKPVDGHGQG